MPDELDPLRRRHYKDPPVVEAIARLQWTSPIPWTFTTPGILFERLREEYPEEPKAQALVRAEVVPAETSVEDEGMNAGFQLSAESQRILFAQKGGTRLLGVSASDISVHGLRPYEGWEELEARLADGIARLQPVLGEKVTASTISVRYINRVELPASSVEFNDYLTITLDYPPGYPSRITAFLDRVEMEYPDESVKLAFTWASTEAEEGKLAFILDLDLLAAISEPIPLEEAMVVLRDLKLKEGRAFEGLLQDRLRKEFGELGE